MRAMTRVLGLFLILGLLASCATTGQRPQDGFVPQPGDLLFQDLDGSPLCTAIEKVTQGVDGAKFSHVGMVSRVQNGEPVVIEAVSAGVVETPLGEFLARSADAEGHPKVIVGRLKGMYRQKIPAAIEAARAYLGRPYDTAFTMDDSSLYCSELVYDAFLQASGKPLFELQPMTFNDPDTQAPFPAWVEHYAKLNVPIPEGEPGLNPGGMSRSPLLEIVHAYGRPEGYKTDVRSNLRCEGSPMISVMTYNIRYGSAADGPDRWDARKDGLLKLVRDENPDILATQEGLAFQIDFLQQGLPEYARFGMDRDANGKGEHAVVFYRTDRFGLIEGGNFWISQTPTVPATRSWESHHNRIVTWLQLHEYATGRSFRVYNTHLDVGSEEARYQGAVLIRQAMEKLPKGTPVIVTGDFNAAAGESRPWETLTDAGLADSWMRAEAHEGPVGTFTGFELNAEERPDRIDWILVSPQFSVKRCATVTTLTNGRHPSDHRPVCARLAWREPDANTK